MSALILLVLLIGGVLYLAGCLLYLYRYLQARRMHPGTPRLWDSQRHRFWWLFVVGGVLTVAFFATAWWSGSSDGFSWLPEFMTPHHERVAAQVNQGEAVPPPQPRASGVVPPFTPPPETSSSTTTESTTTSSTSTSDSTQTTSTTLPPRPEPVAKATSQPKAAKRAAAGGDAWTVCAASFRRETVANNYAKRLVDQGLPARVNQVDLGKRGTWHRVCVGNFATLDQAKGQYKAWEKQGLISDAFLLPLR